MNLHSIYFAHDDRAAQRLPDRIRLNTETFKALYPRAKHVLHSLESADAFIERHFDRETLHSFHALRPLSYKSDLLRFCALHHAGGLYSDLSLMHFAPMELSGAPRMVFFRDMSNNAPFIVSTAFFHAMAGEPVLERCIQRINANVRSRFYGVNPLHPTGPLLFGEVLATQFEAGTMRCGDVVSVNRKDNYATYLYCDADGSPLAIRHKTGDGLSRLGAAHDSYNEIYKSRQVYGEKIDHAYGPGEILASGWCVAGRLQDGDLACHAQRGIAVFGPYLRLPAGSYDARVSFASVAAHAGISVEVSAGAGARRLALAPARGRSVVVPFNLPETTDGIEVRILSRAGHPFALRQIRLVATGDTPAPQPV